MRRALSLAVFAALTACGPSFDPASQVQKLRLLALRAEPPEVGAAGGAIADRAAISSLVADPAALAAPAAVSTILHLACTPDPRNPDGVDCTSIEALRDPAALAALVAAGGSGTSGLGVVGGVSLVGVEACDGKGPCGPATIGAGTGTPTTLPPPLYVVPPGLDLASLPAGAPARVIGVQVSVLSIRVAATPDELFAGDPSAAGQRLGAFLAEREHVIAVKRLQVRGPDALDPPNANPTVPGILADGAPLPADPAAAPRFAPGDEALFSPRPPPIPLDANGQPLEDAVFQPYTRLDQHGAPAGTLHEEWLYSWFATSGSFRYDRTRLDEIDTWTAPDGSAKEPLPPGGRALLFLVVRDARGGIDWAVRELGIAP